MFIAWCASGCAWAINLLNMGSAVDFYAYLCEMQRLLGLLQDNDALICAPCRYVVFYPSHPRTKGQYLENTTKTYAKCMCMHNQSKAQRR